ncbi:MAG: hypothetical protein EAX96_20960 [Candidatus Lokiarchaeota archaeon]|nr:hypothetical protein [Candidatus Lokiarchaeota archaeon]
MGDEKVEEVLDYSFLRDNKGNIHVLLHFKSGESENLKNLPTEEVEYIIDLLRNEASIKFDCDSKKLILTGYELVGEGEVKRPNLNEILSKHENIRKSIIWEDQEGVYPYDEWVSDRKADLEEKFVITWKNGGYYLSDKPENKASNKLDDFVVMVLSKKDAWDLYIATIAHSLVMEFKKALSWSISSYKNEELAVLFDSRKFFFWKEKYNGYQINFNQHAFSLPSPPHKIFHHFFLENGLLAPTRKETIARVLEWSRSNLTHFQGGFETKNILAHWNYEGFTPAWRVIMGTTCKGTPCGVHDGSNRHWIAGCHGMVGFLRSILRLVNIPVANIRVCNNALPYFMTESLYLSHGDDPYDSLSKGKFSADKLFISQKQFDQWFAEGVQDRCDKVGGRPRELAVWFLPLALLKSYCNDLKAGKSHAEGEVYEHLKRNFSLKVLEDREKLWQRLNEKIENIGTCDELLDINSNIKWEDV